MSGFFNILKQGAKTKTGQKILKKTFEYITPKASVGKSKLHKDMAKSKIKMMKDMGSFQKKVGIDKYKEKGGEKIYKKILKIDPGNP
jgi:hypothetical protein